MFLVGMALLGEEQSMKSANSRRGSTDENEIAS
jgi:hypothetical protein